MRILLLASAASLLAASAYAQDAAQDDFAVPPVVMSTEHPAEEAVEPYERANAHAGATPFEGTAMWEAFHGAEGVSRIVDALVDRTNPKNIARRSLADVKAKFVGPDGSVRYETVVPVVLGVVGSVAAIVVLRRVLG